MNMSFFSKYSLLFLKNKKNIMRILSLSALIMSQNALATISAPKQYNHNLDLAHESVLKDYNDNKERLSKNNDNLGDFLVEKKIVVSSKTNKNNNNTVVNNNKTKNKDDILGNFLSDKAILAANDINIVTDKNYKHGNSGINARQEKIVEHITNKYKNLNKDTAEKIVIAAYVKADKYNIEPEVLIAIAGVESNYNPKVVNKIGASGLTQVVKKYHKDKIQKVNARGGNILNISDNLDLGAEIYSDLYHKYGNHTSALQAYNGSLKDKSRSYSKKVIRELNELKGSI